MKHHVRWAALFCVVVCASGLAACPSDDDSRGDAASGSVNDDCDPARGSVAACEALTCDEYSEVTHTWLDSLDACETDADCMLVDLPHCVAACDVAVSADTDLDALQETAEALHAQQAECSCPIARCYVPAAAKCDDGACVVDYPATDAGT